MSDYISTFQTVAASLTSKDFSATDLSAATRRILNNLQSDIGQVHRDSAILFAPGSAGPLPAGHAIARMFVRWRKDPPSMPALLIVAAAHFNIPAETPAFKAALMAAVAAEVPSRLPYHSNHHFREVVAMMARLCDANNALAQVGTAGTMMLSPDDVALCLLAAVGHDLLHDGKGNAPQGNWTPYRLEDRAIAAIAPFMAAAGVSVHDMECARVMIRVTDTSAAPNADSPHKVLRKVFNGDASVTVPPELAALIGDKKLQTLAALMSDADLSPSGATNYLFCRMQTHLFAAETPGFVASDRSMGGFLGFVLENRFLSHAAIAASQPSLSTLVQKVGDRIAAGTPPHPNRAIGP